MSGTEHFAQFTKIRPQHQYMRQNALYSHPEDTIYEPKNETLYEDGLENEANVSCAIHEDSSKDSGSTLDSICDEYSVGTPESESKQAINDRLKTLINILKDDFNPENVDLSYIYDPSIENIQTDDTSSTIKTSKQPQFIINDEDHKVPRMDWDNYHRLDVIHTFMDDLERDYPSICTSGSIGKSVEGRDLKILKISNSDATNSNVWIDAGIHAREWIAPAVATYIANHIAKNFSDMPPSVTNKDWYFLPVVNPDGYEYSHTVDRMWRKSRAWYGGECVGVDLNRNFSCGWGGKGSSGAPTSVFYRGAQPFSEPESSAVRDMLMHAGISFKVYITLHSYGQVIIFPFAHKEALCPDYIRLLEGATVMSKAIYDSSGNTYKVGVSRDVMYGASGTSNDFSYGVAGIPYCYLIELRSKQHKFKLPKEEIEETGEEIVKAIKAFVEFIDKQNTCSRQHNTMDNWNNED
ncbi:hypothetical protein evm_005567 [Chilo suppressalis]|nr:hypothetical protein evm_005567 [Chilo suppressalis]